MFQRDKESWESPPGTKELEGTIFLLCPTQCKQLEPAVETCRNEYGANIPYLTFLHHNVLNSTSVDQPPLARLASVQMLQVPTLVRPTQILQTLHLALMCFVDLYALCPIQPSQTWSQQQQQQQQQQIPSHRGPGHKPC